MSRIWVGNIEPQTCWTKKESQLANRWISDVEYGSDEKCDDHVFLGDDEGQGSCS